MARERRSPLFVFFASAPADEGGEGVCQRSFLELREVYRHKATYRTTSSYPSAPAFVFQVTLVLARTIAAS